MFLRPLARGAGRLLQDRESAEDMVAVLSPIAPDAAFAAEMMQASNGAAAAFQRGWTERFSSLPNLDLDTGEPIVTAEAP